MADITDHSAGLDQPSPGDELTGNGVDPRGTKRPRTSMAGDDDDDDDEKGGRERRKIEIKFIQDKSRRHITFSKRKAGIMKKVSAGSQKTLTPPHPSTYANRGQGIRTVRPYWHTSSLVGRLRNRSCLHLHHSQASTSGHKGRRQEPDPGTTLLLDPHLHFPTDIECRHA